MKFAVIFDPHVSDVAPSTRKDNYKESILKKIEFAIDYANNNACKAILIAGDLFNRKIASHNSHELVANLVSLFKTSEIPIIGIAGNHDISGNVTNIYRQPISVLTSAGVYKLLDGSEPILFEEGNERISLNGIYYNANMDSKEHTDLYNLKYDDGCVNVGLFHQMILPDGMKFFGDYVNFSDLKDVNADVIIDGHYHTGFEGSLVKLGRKKKWFLNSGSLSRGSSDKFNLSKNPCFAVLTVSGTPSKYNVSNEDIEVPFLPSADAFDLEMVEKRKENKQLKEFIANLSEVEADALQAETPDGIIAILKTMKVEKRLIAMADKYLEEAYKDLGA